MFKSTILLGFLCIPSLLCSQEPPPVINVGLASAAGGSFAELSGSSVVFAVHELGQGQGDLNGDGDTEDEVLHVYHLESGETTNLGLPMPEEFAWGGLVSGDWFAFTVPELSHGRDLNGDGDEWDSVAHVHDLRTGDTSNLGLGVSSLQVSGNTLAFSTDGGQLHLRELDTGATRNLAIADILDGGGDWVLSDNWVVLRTDGTVHVHNLETGETRDLELSAGMPPSRTLEVSGNSLTLRVDEGRQGADLNGDGDTADEVLHVHDLETGETVNLGVAGTSMIFCGCGDSKPSANWVTFRTDEDRQGADLNGDGDTSDVVVHAYNPESGETRNLGLNVFTFGGFGGCTAATLSGKWLVLGVHEFGQGEGDLNGDGDRTDVVVHVHNLETAETTIRQFVNLLPYASLSGDRLAFFVHEGNEDTDLNSDGDKDDTVLHVHELDTGQTKNLKLVGACPFRLSGNWLVLTVPESSQGTDFNGDGDADDNVLHLVDLSRFDGFPRFLRGDCNANGEVDISDGIFALNFLFRADEPADCLAACNANSDEANDISDAVFLFNFLFADGTPLRAPFPACGRSVLASDLEVGCGAHHECQ